MTNKQTDLIARHRDLVAKEPRMRARDLAQKLGISEAELVSLGKEGVNTTRLRPDWSGIINAVGQTGRVMALTRNESCVHERKGVYGPLEGGGHVGLIVGEDIDLRIFFSHWRYGFAVMEGERRSLQFFDESGMAVHKIYATDTTDIIAFDKLIADYELPDPSPLDILAATPKAAPLPDTDIDIQAFHTSWDGLTDTHQFHGLLGKFKLARTQALRLAGRARATSVPAQSLRRILMSAADKGTPIMVFVGNRGMIQIHTGPVANLKPMGPWFNVMDEAFNLHLREDHIASAYVVRKPTDDGTVTSLELFDAEGETIATLFGKRKPGQSEDPAWREIVEDLCAKEAA